MLTISLTAELGARDVTGNPHVIVRRGGSDASVKEVDKTVDADLATPILTIIDEAHPALLGVYLPAGFTGGVDVEVRLLSVGCVRAGHGSTVASGQTASVEIALAPTRGCASQTPDGGADAAEAHPAPVPDAGQDAADEAADDAGEDARAADDAPGDRETDIFTSCSDYCAAYAVTCGDPTPGAPSTCAMTCVEQHWSPGNPDAATGENTFACRLRHLRAAQDPSLRCSECPAASPESFGVCGTSAPEASRDACPFTDTDASAAP